MQDQDPGSNKNPMAQKRRLLAAWGFLFCIGFSSSNAISYFSSQLFSGLRRVGEAWIAWWASEIEEEFFLLPSPLPVASPDNKGLEIALVDRSPFRTDQRLHIVLSCLQSPKVVTMT